MLWSSALFFIVLAVWMANTRYLNRLRNLSRVARQLAADEAPDGFIRYDKGLLGELSWNLQKIADRQAGLRRRLIEQESHYRSLLASVAPGALFVDRGRVIQFVTGDCLTQFEIRTEPLGNTGVHVLRDANIDKVVTAVLETGKPQELTPGKGKFNAAARPVYESSGTISGVVIAFRSIRGANDDQPAFIDASTAALIAACAQYVF